MSSLVLIGRLSVRFDHESGGLIFNPMFCHIKDMGFCREQHEAITDRPPRPNTIPYDHWCRERSLVVSPDDSVRSVGRAEIRENRVYDEYYRGEIDFTGIRVTLSFRRDAYQAYMQHIGKAKPPELTDRTSWDGSVLYRLPSHPFDFPMPRGSSHPWNNENAVGKLKPIKRFNFDRIEVQLLRDGQGRKVALEGESCADPLEMESALFIGELSNSPRWWTKLLP